MTVRKHSTSDAWSRKWLWFQACTGLVILSWAATSAGGRNTEPLLFVAVSAVFLFIIVGDIGRLSDKITLARVSIVISTLILSQGELLSPIAAASLVGFALILDRIDGLFARREGATHRGAFLDMETDQLVVLSLSLHAVLVLAHPKWVLLLPAFKYIDFLLRTGLSMNAGEPRPNPDGNLRARIVCGITMGALWAAATPLVSGTVSSTVTAFCVGLLGWSFYEDFRFQWSAPNGRARA